MLNLKRERNHQLYSAGTPDYLKDILFEIPALFALTWNCCLNSFLLSLFLIFNSINIIQKFPKNKQYVPKNKLFSYFFDFSVDKWERVRYTIIVLRNK
ncbi:hypothetical protein P7573_28 [Streptococcus phage P7573]|uniref:Uncharacterized protein n=2 Tax=Aliceevansviridae TaxID=3044455 RepID=A0A286QR42_9CAUD|nr:hypothetical protein PP239_gp28 [Streptococcus phage P7573]YP_010683241.1 hypothetical protein PQF05_gp28 [Streptococcus phage P7955]ARU13872.1 hypothetical protein P7573_28 [Streptococcus phage P7573]ARU14397.1 hypothetical protein P7955_28 [Streptococcus phage P7955]